MRVCTLTNLIYGRGILPSIYVSVEIGNHSIRVMTQLIHNIIHFLCSLRYIHLHSHFFLFHFSWTNEWFNLIKYISLGLDKTMMHRINGNKYIDIFLFLYRNYSWIHCAENEKFIYFIFQQLLMFKNGNTIGMLSILCTYHWNK